MVFEARRGSSLAGFALFLGCKRAGIIGQINRAGNPAGAGGVKRQGTKLGRLAITEGVKHDVSQVDSQSDGEL